MPTEKQIQNCIKEANDISASYNKEKNTYSYRKNNFKFIINLTYDILDMYKQLSTEQHKSPPQELKDFINTVLFCSSPAISCMVFRILTKSNILLSYKDYPYLKMFLKSNGQYIQNVRNIHFW